MQIDESLFSSKPKHHEGCSDALLWVFGMVDTSNSPAIGYMEIVENRSADVLLPIIKKVIRPGSIIHSDQWKSYRNLQEKGYNHRTVNHSLHFVKLINGAHTQAIESYLNEHS